MSMLIIYIAVSPLVKEVAVLVFPFSFSMVSLSKASASKKKASDASSSTAAPGHDPEPKPSDSANLQIHMKELEGAMKRAISIVDQDRGAFADLKQALLDRVTRIHHLGDYMLAICCSMRLIDLESLINKLENLRQVDLESEVESFLVSARRREAWQRECRRRDREDKESLITRLDLRRRLLQAEMEGTAGSISLGRTPYAEGE
ncbi:uncharacterized protein A4U43_C08F14500 [Asparagus officinalis]|nr:uncharacterized protein A4U43_C08F14500 [Asparagus officinalis]